MLQVRKAIKTDVESIHNLIKELAIFEKAPNEVSNTVEIMLEDGFGNAPIYNAFVAELNGVIIGAAITYYRYSTWKGKCLYLEDLIVTEKHRGIGAGKSLFDRCIEFGKENNCKKMNWQVLDWNTPAIDFYKKYNADLDNEWINGTVEL
ncbi:MAG: GNAT family N-acetyltransferase [Bacteroidia bacterium]|nr:GNAT family N-acetyltransferase [Bacteroidia bacterium]